MYFVGSAFSHFCIILEDKNYLLMSCPTVPALAASWTRSWTVSTWCWSSEKRTCLGSSALAPSTSKGWTPRWSSSTGEKCCVPSMPYIRKVSLTACFTSFFFVFFAILKLMHAFVLCGSHPYKQYDSVPGSYCFGSWWVQFIFETLKLPAATVKEPTAVVNQGKVGSVPWSPIQQ